MVPYLSVFVCEFRRFLKNIICLLILSKFHVIYIDHIHPPHLPDPPASLPAFNLSFLFIFERCVYYIYEFCMHGYMHTLCVPGVCGVRGKHQIPYNWSYRWSRAIPYRYRTLNPSLLQEQEVLLTTESSFQPYLFMYLFYVITYRVQFELPISPQEWGHPLEPDRPISGHTLKAN